MFQYLKLKYNYNNKTFIKKIRFPKINFLKKAGTDFPFVADNTNFGIKSRSSF